MSHPCPDCGNNLPQFCPWCKCGWEARHKRPSTSLVPIVQRKPDTIQLDPFKNIHIIKQCEAVVDAWDKRQELQ